MATAASWLLTLGLVVPSSAALGQYRPPPMSEAQRLVAAADQARIEGVRDIAADDGAAARPKLSAATKGEVALAHQVTEAGPALEFILSAP